MKHLLPRFRIATLLAITGAIAFMLWAIPAWKEYQRRMEFEAAARQLSVGLNPSLLHSLPGHSHEGHLNTTNYFDAAGVPSETSFFRYKHYWYCIYRHTRPPTAEEMSDLLVASRNSPASVGPGGRRSAEYWEDVRVYRLRPPSAGYLAQTELGKRKVHRYSEADGRMKGTPEERTSREQYETDFLQIITGHEPSNLGLEYELIHSAGVP